jgi:hypothetical protein
MITTRPHRRQGHRIWEGSASLLVILLLLAVARPWAGASRLEVTVYQGRLSVNLWQANLGEVLAQIHQQAGIAIRVSPSTEHTVSVQFTDVTLDHGLRRLLQLASRSYAMRYAPGLTGEVALQEVQVFAGAPAGDQSPAGVPDAGEKPGAEVGQHFIDAVLQRQAASPAVVRGDESDAAQRFRETLERNAAPAPGLTDAPESDAAQRFRDALEDFTGATQR